MRYEKYVIGKMFTSQNGDTDIKKEDITGTGVPVITSGVDKDGVLGKTDIKARIIKANTITIDMFGNAFFRPFEYKMVTHARVFSMELIGKEMNEAIGLFLVAQFHWLPNKYNYGDMCSYTKIKNSTITLPTLDKLDENSPYSEKGFVPDFDYMQKYIEELKQKHIEKLEQYLVATGLNDCELTEKDNKILALNKEKKEFAISDLFEIKKGKRLTKQQHTAGKTPFIGATSLNNGITSFIGQEPIFEGNAITVSYNGSVGQVFYQEKPFWASDDINVLYLKGKTLNKELFGYLGGAISKASTLFSYTNKWNVARMSVSKILLPIQTDSFNNPIIDLESKYHQDGYVPDWLYMEDYIGAVEKVVIKDTVKYKNNLPNIGVVAQTL
jgi:hypothetical protein